MKPEQTLETIVDQFNQSLSAWEGLTSHGANFEWQYSQEGYKRLRIKDVAPNKLPEDKAAEPDTQQF